MAWEIKVDDYGDEVWYGGDGCGMITVNGWTNGGYKKDDPEKWAKLLDEANLIAEVPNMLAALEEVTKADGFNAIEALKKAQSIARAAIKKARRA
jgi:hypothetical protein